MTLLKLFFIKAERKHATALNFLFFRSSDGLETMKLFVIANSVVMLTTIVYPQIQNVYGILFDMFYGDDIFE